MPRTLGARWAARFFTAVLCLLLLGGHSPARALTVLSPTLYPLHYADDTGIAKGYSFDLLALLMRSHGRTLDRASVRFSPLARALTDATRATSGMVVGLTRTPDREESFQWVGPIVHLRLGLVARKDRELRTGNEDAEKELVIAVVRGSEGESLIKHCPEFRSADLLTVNSFSNQFRMLEYGRVDAAVHADLTAPRTLLNLGLNPDDYEMVHVLQEIDL